jgi:sterol desaturase/sphingolipid hydroxylase (fatty acid hydroxylase superfamily)
MKITVIDYLSSLPFAWGRITTVYLLSCGFFYFLLNYVLKPFLKNRIIDGKIASSKQVSFEILHSLKSVALTAVITSYIDQLIQRGHSKIYTNLDEFGVGYLIFSSVLLILLHDTYFYWAHRLMHKCKLLIPTHMIHHKSVICSPWASRSFGIIETLLQAAFILTMIFIIPVHQYAIVTFGAHMIIFNVMGHSGFDLFPKSWIDHPILKYRTSATHHSIHHKRPNYHFGLYFTWWDQWMGTEHPEYRAEFLKNAQPIEWNVMDAVIDYVRKVV